MFKRKFALIATLCLVAALGLFGCGAGDVDEEAGSVGDAVAVASDDGSDDVGAADPEASAADDDADSVTADSDADDAESDGAVEASSAPDLTGDWSSGYEPDENTTWAMWFTLTIDEEHIYVYLYSYSTLGEDGVESSSGLIWVGSYVAPESDEAYSWVSEIDEELLAELSGLTEENGVELADTITFYYEDGVLSFVAMTVDDTDYYVEYTKVE